MMFALSWPEGVKTKVLNYIYIYIFIYICSYDI